MGQIEGKSRSQERCRKKAGCFLKKESVCSANYLHLGLWLFFVIRKRYVFMGMMRPFDCSISHAGNFIFRSSALKSVPAFSREMEAACRHSRNTFLFFFFFGDCVLFLLSLSAISSHKEENDEGEKSERGIGKK